MANHVDIGTPALPVQNWDEVIGRIEGIHECKHLPIWRPSQAQRKDHGDEALLERRLNGFDLFPVLDAPYLHTSHPIPSQNPSTPSGTAQALYTLKGFVTVHMQLHCLPLYAQKLTLAMSPLTIVQHGIAVLPDLVVLLQDSPKRLQQATI